MKYLGKTKLVSVPVRNTKLSGMVAHRRLYKYLTSRGDVVWLYKHSHERMVG